MNSQLIQRSLPRAGAGFLGFAMLVCASARASAQQEELLSADVERFYDSGYASNPTSSEQTVIAFPVHVAGATWVRLQFASVELAGDPDLGTGSILRITSLFDADAQTMNERHVAQWHGTSCYLNGGDVLVEVVAQPWTGRNRVVLSKVTQGLSFGSDSQCGPTDDRVLSGDGRAARLLPIGCTGWMIDDCRTCLLTAGHCGTSQLQTVEFNVPLSSAGGALVHPPAADQYAVDLGSLQTNGGQGIGNDWSYFGCFPNSNTGKTPFGAQLVRFHLAAPPPYNAAQSIRVTGYGVDSGTSNQVQQTHSGPWITSSGSLLQYQVDTTGGNSGSPVSHEPTGDAIGIHTHGGCQTNGTGQNSGTASTHPGLAAALAAPHGVCLGSGVCQAVGHNYCVTGGRFSVISATGSASVAANDLVLHVNNVPLNKPGLFLYSLSKQNVPLSGNSGNLCVGGAAPIVRLGSVNSGALTTFTFAVDYGALPAAGPITAGSVYNFQAWYRSGTSTTETTNGLTISFGP